MREIWKAHDELVVRTPNRSVYWGVQKTYEEADEFRVTDPDIDAEHFVEEGADVILAWMTTMKTAGISYDTALEAIQLKLNVVIDRAIETSVMTHQNGEKWDDNYEQVKKEQA